MTPVSLVHADSPNIVTFCLKDRGPHLEAFGVISPQSGQNAILLYRADLSAYAHVSALPAVLNVKITWTPPPCLEELYKAERHQRCVSCCG